MIVQQQLSMPLAKLIRRLRTARRLSRRQLGVAMGYAPSGAASYLSRMEDGSTMPTLPTLLKFAKAIDYPAWKIVRKFETFLQNPGEN